MLLNSGEILHVGVFRLLKSLFVLYTGREDSEKGLGNDKIVYRYHA